MKRIVRNFLAAASAVALVTLPVAAQQARPDLDPAVWVVADEDTTIYLFGTVHALDGKGDWFNDEVKSSFDKSQELVLEIIAPDDPMEMQPLVMKYAIDTSGKTLSSKLGAEHAKLLSDTLDELGVPAAAKGQFEIFKPFFAALNINVMDMMKNGIDPEKGAEKTLTVAAKEKKMTLGNVETAEEQLAMLASLSEKDQIDMLVETLEEREKSREILAKLMGAWGEGKADVVAELIDEMESKSAALHKVMFLDRNERWAEWIDNRLDQPGTVFMAVGAGHLAGNGSVQDFLTKRGIETKRVPAEQ